MCYHLSNPSHLIHNDFYHSLYLCVYTPYIISMCIRPLYMLIYRFARVCIEDAIKHGRQRKTFGKRLMDHQVLRHKIVEMSRQVEANHAHLELLAYQMKQGIDERELSKYMGLLKIQCTKTMEFCAREASQILGGNSYIRGGVGERVERLYREVRVNAIGGGSEEIMADLVAKQANL